MNIVVFDADPWERDAFEPLADHHELSITADPLDEHTAAEHAGADVVSSFIYSSLTRDVLRQFDDLGLIATRSTGVDHVDAGFCKQHHIAVSNVPSYGSNTVAEHTFTLLLAVARRLVDAVDRTRRGDFSPRGLRGFDLHGKTLGVVGAGDIGRHAARIGVGLGMDVLAFDIQQDEHAAEEIGFRYVSLDELLKRSDVVTVHVPASDKTKGMIGQREFGLMRSHAVLINTARGDVVEVEPLVDALAHGRIAGAGLDVLPQEPVIREEAELYRSIYEERNNLQKLLADHVLVNMPNVVVTPHSAFNTREAVERILQTTVNNITAFTKGDEPPDRVL